MLAYGDPADVTAARAAGFLTRGGQIKTPIKSRPKLAVSAAGTVILQPGDEVCTDCNSLINGFGKAPYILVLGRMKRATGDTYCKACHRSDGATQEAKA